jgi:chromosome segregation ATPase
MSDRVQERAVEIAKDFQKALDAVKDKRNVIREINNKIAGCRENLQAYRTKETELLGEVEALGEQFSKSLSSSQDTEAIHQKKVEAEQSVKRHQEMITELEKKVIPQLEKDLQVASEEARDAFSRELMMLHSDYQKQLNETLQDTVAVELLAWPLAYHGIAEGLEIRVPLKPLRLKNREVENALL